MSTSVADVVALISAETKIGNGNASSSTTSEDLDVDDSNQNEKSSPSRLSATLLSKRRNKNKGAGGKGAWNIKGTAGGLVGSEPDAGVAEQVFSDAGSLSSGGNQSKEGRKDEQGEKLEECSFWVACGADAKVGQPICFSLS